MLARRRAALAAALLASLHVAAALALDCASAIPIGCGATVQGDLTAGVANQDSYGCSLDDFSGAEQLYTITLANPTTLRITLQAGTGDPDLVVLSPCDPLQCAMPPQDAVLLTDAVGTFTLVVDAATGDEGAYSLEVECLGETFAFCTESPGGGDAVELDPWGLANGDWLVPGWLYYRQNTHDRALRIDGGRKYSHSDGCPAWSSVSFSAAQPDGPGVVRWTAPEVEVEETLSETTDGGCCGLLVEVRVTNRDAVPHFFEWRTYHDTAFGDGVVGGLCDNADASVDGGAIEVSGARHVQEVDLLSLGGDTCEGQVKFFSGDTNDLRASFEMLQPNTPVVMEFLRWPNGLEPCTTWSGMVDGDMLVPATNDCTDNSMLLIWRFPGGSGTLQPGESATASYRIGWNCTWPCGPCEAPVLATGSATDASACNDGLLVAWDAAVFPAAGNGAYHVYRSTASFADALAQPRISPLLGVGGTSFLDNGTVANETYYYVVQAESTDFPGCGAGPLVDGSTDEIDVGPVTDSADMTGPAGIVGDTLRATGHTDDTVDFEWPLAPAPEPGERYVILRSDARPEGPFTTQATTVARSWTDPDAPPRWIPSHVWFYDVRIADDCDNRSLD